MFQGGKRRYTSSKSNKSVCLNFCFVYFLFSSACVSFLVFFLSSATPSFTLSAMHH